MPSELSRSATFLNSESKACSESRLSTPFLSPCKTSRSLMSAIRASFGLLPVSQKIERTSWSRIVWSFEFFRKSFRPTSNARERRKSLRGVMESLSSLAACCQYSSPFSAVKKRTPFSCPGTAVVRKRSRMLRSGFSCLCFQKLLIALTTSGARRVWSHCRLCL